ncbi:MAG: exonuclease [Pseudorhodobacter sp.]
MPDGGAKAHAVILDCEFLVSEGSQQRFWCGPYDPDPTVAQIGAVRISLQAPFDIVAQQSWLIAPRSRFGDPVEPDPFFTELTGVSALSLLEAPGLAQVLTGLVGFAQDAPLWSWGKDELNLMAITCYVEGVSPPIPAARFGNLCALMIQAGMPYEVIKKTRSNNLPAYFGLNFPDLRAHDALDDALSLTRTVQHLLRAGRLRGQDFLAPK